MTARAASRRCRVAVIGAGFGGLATAWHLAQAGIDDVVILERQDGVGGTWRANRYPGAACDVPSHLYSLSFAPNPGWSRAYASQPEILAYVEDCYDRFDVRGKVRTKTTVVAAEWQDDRRCWRITTDPGGRLEADVLVSAVGLFHTPSDGGLAGLADFGGPVVHSARWPDHVDLGGRRVAVVGTGASAIQVVPAICDHVEHLTLYQRTPAWVLPRKDPAFTDEEKRAFAQDPDHARRYRQQLYQQFEQTTAFIAGDPFIATLTQVALGYLERKVPDADLRAKLTPTFPIGCKRTLVSSDFYPAVQRPNVELVTEAIDRVTAGGVRTVDGTERACDTVVLCTGFRATEYLRGIIVRGRGGVDLHQQWAGVPRAWHGMMVPGFPNFFMLYGPNTNQGGNSIILILEAQGAFVARTVSDMAGRGADTAEVGPAAMDRYRAELGEALGRTVWSGGCDSYFRTPGGDVVTQLPWTAGWYASRLEQMPGAEDAALR